MADLESSALWGGFDGIDPAHWKLAAALVGALALLVLGVRVHRCAARLPDAVELSELSAPLATAV